MTGTIAFQKRPWKLRERAPESAKKGRFKVCEQIPGGRSIPLRLRLIAAIALSNSTSLANAQHY
jgi:hypothetical protein